MKNKTLLEIEKLNEKLNFASEIIRPYDNNMCFSVKNNIMCKGFKISCSSKILKGHIASYNATVIELLIAKGYKINMITNCDEFGMGTYGVNGCCKIVFHKKNLNNECKCKFYSAGGSSSGSSVSVSTNVTEFSLGTDTGGSVRLPAALSNLYGFKPSYGSVSRFGLTSFSSSLDQIGIFTRDIHTMKRVFNTISVEDEKDSQNVKYFKKFYNNSQEIITCNLWLNFNVLSDYIPKLMLNRYKRTFLKLKNKDSVVLDESTTKKIILNSYKSFNLYKIISSVEAFSNLLRFNGRLLIEDDLINDKIVEHNEILGDFNFETNSIRNLFGQEVKKRITTGLLNIIEKNKYIKAVEDVEELEDFFNQVLTNDMKVKGVLITPTILYDEIILHKTENNIKINKKYKYIDLFLMIVNLFKGCGLTLPFKLSKNNLDIINIQLIGCRGDDKKVLDFSETFVKNRK